MVKAKYLRSVRVAADELLQQPPPALLQPRRLHVGSGQHPRFVHLAQARPRHGGPSGWDPPRPMLGVCAVSFAVDRVGVLAALTIEPLRGPHIPERVGDVLWDVELLGPGVCLVEALNAVGLGAAPSELVGAS